MAGTSQRRAAPQRAFSLLHPRVPEAALHEQIAAVLTTEIAPAGKVSPDGVCWFSIDMAAYSGTAPGLRTARGCIAGVPDIFILHRGRAHHIELKASDGGEGLSPAQQSVGTAILIGGGRLGVACSAEQVLACIDEWRIPRHRRITL